ncbi:MAG: hypothetical protein Kow00109_25250 [Acidobacteriota bacterium]
MLHRRGAVAALVVAIGVVACGPRVIRKEPIPRERQLQALRIMAEGDELLRQGKDHLAMLKYLEASQLDPYQEIIFNKLATAYIRLGMDFQAAEAAERAVRLNPRYAYGYNTLGIVRLTRRDIKGAAKAFQKAIEYQNDVAGFYINYGFTLVQLGKAKEAIAAYRQGFRLNPKILQTASRVKLPLSPEEDFSAEKYLELARIFAELGNLEYVLRYLDRAFIAGLTEPERILRDPAFEKLLKEEEFRRFLISRGVSL